MFSFAIVFWKWSRFFTQKIQIKTYNLQHDIKKCIFISIFNRNYYLDAKNQSLKLCAVDGVDIVSIHCLYKEYPIFMLIVIWWITGSGPGADHGEMFLVILLPGIITRFLDLAKQEIILESPIFNQSSPVTFYHEFHRTKKDIMHTF